MPLRPRPAPRALPGRAAPLAGCAPLAILVFGRLVLGATPALAQDHIICLEPSGTAVPSCINGRNCDEFRPDFDAGLARAAEVVGAGSAASPIVCANELASIDQRVVVDNSAGQYGSLELAFGGTPICPPSGTDPGEPAVTLTPGTYDIVTGLALDFGGSCAQAARPGVQVLGTGGVAVSGTIVGTTGYGVDAGDDVGQTTHLRWLQIRDCQGAAIKTGRRAFLRDVQVLGCDAGPVALLESRTGGHFQIRSSLLAANIAATGSPGLISGEVMGFENSAFVLNAVEPDVPLLSLPTWTPSWDLDGTQLVSNQSSILHSTFSRNVVVDDVSAVNFGATPDVGPPDPSAEVCITDGLSSWLDGVATPAAATTGTAPLVRAQSVGSGFLAVLRSTFVGNRVGDGPLIELAGNSIGVSVQFIHDTFADNNLSTLFAATGPGAPDELLVLRNLVLGETATGAPLLEPDVAAARLVVAGNVHDPALTWLSAAAEEGALIALPPVVSGTPELRPDTDFDGWTACQQHQLRCPGSTSADCAAWLMDVTPHCIVDRTDQWFLTPAFVSTLPSQWPWETDFFDLGGPGGDIPGAGGWTCEGVRPTVDSLSTPAWGDGDGYPDAFDCDNDDAQLIPTVPDDPDDPWCVPAPGDDDDATQDDDDATQDDDDATQDDDDSSVLDDDDDDATQAAPTDEVPVGCAGRGCGAAIPQGGASALLLLLAPLGLTRRRRA